MLKPFLVLSAASLFVLSPALVKAGGSQDAAQAPAASHAGASNPVKPTAETLAKAKGLYAIDCAMCHGDNGNGQTDLAKSMSLTMVDFTNGKAMSTKTDGDLFDIIRNGKDKMPPESSGRASDTMVWNIIVYIRKMAGTEAAAAK
jgi:mono/diheme cytochrome c family protein